MQKTIMGFIKRCKKCGDFILSAFGFHQYCEFCKPPKSYPYSTGEWKRLRKEILIRDEGVCFYCGKAANCVDHIIPLSKHGTNDKENLCCCCRSCNSRKSNRMPYEIQKSKVCQ